MIRRIMLVVFVVACVPFACSDGFNYGHLGQLDSKIINGIPDTTHDAVVFVYPVGCSGTIIHQDSIYIWVLTAAHCVPPNGAPEPEYIIQADDWTDQDAILYPADDYIDHPSYSGNDWDFALIRALGGGPASPIIPARQSPDGISSGTPIKHVGYGLLTYPSGDTTLRHYGNGTVSDTYSNEFEYNQVSQGPCHGDSGGPQLSTGTEYVLGVTSRGVFGCIGLGISGRVAYVYNSFISPYINNVPAYDCDTCTDGVIYGVGVCTSYVDACYDHTDCSSLLQCLSGCSTSQCQQDCINQHPSGYAVYQQIWDCVCETGCNDVCSGESWCNPLGDLGDPCTDGDECQSTICVDGRCCNDDCTGQCEACDVAGDLGYCSAVTGDPHDTRPACAGDGTVCDGSCNGVNRNACFFPGSSTQCRAPSCDAGQAILEADCDGAGSCPSEQTQDCGTFGCDGDHCGGTCQIDGDCPGGYYCDPMGQCLPKKDLGQACSLANECLSLNCVDGVCCNTNCPMLCQACDVAGLLGTCSPVTGAPHGTRPDCASDGTACGGFCNGVHFSGCTYPGAETQCRAPSCTGGLAVLEGFCEGSGACPSEQTQACAPYDCVGDHCGGCLTDGDCPDGNFCNGGVCLPKYDLGQDCSAANQCIGNVCVDNVCCNGPCSGQCEACDVAGHLGACWPVSGDPHGSRPACASDGSICGGSCNGLSRTTCTFPGAGSQCRAPSCTAGLASLAADCDGAGACPPLMTQDCDPYDCNGDFCDGPCTTDAQCGAGYFCSAGVCVETYADGEICAGDNQCQSDSCTDGVCCASDCAGQCEACDVTGSLGVCTAVSGAPHGARQACTSDGSACGGDCDGSNRTACAYPGAETVCRTGSCSAQVAVLAANCAGAGACPSEQTINCTPYDCDGDICGGGCVDNDDCGQGYFCAAGMCLTQFEAGHSCATDGQCLSGFCVDGVCCDAVCDGQCEACNASGSEGTCAAVSGAPRGGRAACLGTGVCQGQCDGSDRDVCTFPGIQTICVQAACSNGLQTNAAVCDAAGNCGQADTVSCGDYVCGAEECLSSCSFDADCIAGKVCNDNACVEDGTSDSSGCGCGAPAGQTPILPALGLFVLLGMAVRRRW
ncbi:MAG: hypothetical protein JRJ87_07995 [Deltaproteobacteria bacterium]|nr:hypothetical protein [Deltaproteobacteria bacterium]